MIKIITVMIIFFSTPVFSGTYQIEGDFDGCEYGKLYPIVGGGILECLEYNYFYDYSKPILSINKPSLLYFLRYTFKISL